jgi:glutamate/tyrosine decarboxylase-like PLP-dependent enzyme
MQPGSATTLALPDRGLAPEEVRRLVDDAATGDMAWRDGRGWALVYDLPGEHADLVQQTAAQFGNENGLSHSAFPSAATFESAVISMVASVAAPAGAHGVFTSGGTESILLAVKAARDRPGARGDCIVIPATAHPAFGKAAHYLGLRQRKVPVGGEAAVDPAEVEAAVDADTLMIAASAPNFPFGVVDPIVELGVLAAERELPFHVDAALGGLFLPFLDGAGVEPPRFGLDVPGVTSVSVDLHKYGYGAKGASVLLFGDPALRRAVYYVDHSWPGGAYAAAGVLGTKPVGPAAAAYASMMSLGATGYRAQVAAVMATTRALQEGLTRELPFTVVGSPAMSVFAVASDHATVAAAARGLSARGWWIDALLNPPALHLIVFPRHASIVDELLRDAAAALADAPPTDNPEQMSSYGVMVRGSATDSGLDDEVLMRHLDHRFDG